MAAPINKAKYSGIEVNVWEREIQKDGETFTIQSINIIKPYKDKKTDKWENGTSFKLSDIPYIIMALVDVFSWKYKREIPKVESSSAEPF